MAVLILGLVLFLGAHSVRIFANDWRSRQVARLGEKGWKGLYTLVSIAGFALIIWGFGLARQQPVLLYVPPIWLRHLNALFTLIAFILVVAAYVPGNHFKAKLGHPMLAGVKTWAFGHLLATGMLHDVVLFGAFLLWAVVDFISARRRDRAAGVSYQAGTAKGDLIVVVAGVVAWAVFAFWLHGWLIGVKPMG
ncbi:NnrU family protein [Dyella jiangningensis]|uniref:NnrU family protein n=1 Tax=Dyella jiangningensis TaxID=1379159 RepID=UPI002410995D|nr:NnrU family protein [Dyella jiangningensis]MDG2539516.1 NnrU family protein [Dyella jiangningensis]